MRVSGELKIILGASLFAFIPVCVKIGSDLSIYSLLFGRLLLASLILFVFQKKNNLLLKLKAREYFILFCWSQLMLGAMITYFLAINYSSISISSALLGVQPIVIILLAVFFLKEKLSFKNLIAALITLFGILLITGIDGLNNTKFYLGELFALCSAVLLGLNFFLQKQFLGKYSGQELVFYQGIFQLPLLLPFLFFETGSLTFNSISAIVLLAVLCTVLAYSLIYNGIKQVDAQKIGVLQSVEYVVPIFIGITFFSEKLTLTMFVGIACILGACIYVGLQPNKKS